MRRCFTRMNRHLWSVVHGALPHVVDSHAYMWRLPATYPKTMEKAAMSSWAAPFCITTPNKRAPSYIQTQMSVELAQLVITRQVEIYKDFIRTDARYFKYLSFVAPSFFNTVEWSSDPYCAINLTIFRLWLWVYASTYTQHVPL